MPESFKSIFPVFDSKEQKIVTEIIRSGGDVVRTILRKKVGGSNTTFVSKIEKLKDKGIIEEYKQKNQRKKTTYRFSYHYAQLLNFSDILTDKKWFSANQKIELFPEFEKIAKILMGKGVDVYKTLGIEPQHISLETSLVTNESSTLNETKVRNVLSLCNAYLQNVVTQKIHPDLKDKAEGYIIFHYNLEKPDAELQRLLPLYLSKYLSAKNSLDEYNAISKLGELTVKYSELITILVAAATQVSTQIQISDLKKLKNNFKYFKDSKKPDHITIMQALDSCLKIFKQFYNLNINQKP
jgi:DNA-binding Lrp family transcriptional regulator